MNKLDETRAPIPKPLFVGIAKGGPLDGRELRFHGRMARLTQKDKKVGHYVYLVDTWHWCPPKERTTPDQVAARKRAAEEKRTARAEKRRPPT
jgi:hypothetical protein